MAHVVIQLAPFLLLAAAVLACGQVFLVFNRQIRALAKSVKRQQERMEIAQAAWEAEARVLQTKLAEAEARAGVLAAPPPPRSGFNLSKRSQAMRMSRLGERPENIAAALSVPRKEIELMLKIQKIVLNSAGATSSPSAPGSGEHSPPHRVHLQ